MLSVADRTYEDGRMEWRRDIGDGWIEWIDDRGGSGYDKDLGNGWFRRGMTMARITVPTSGGPVVVPGNASGISK